MDNFGIQLKVLFDILIKKKKVLEQILSISENQESILLSGQEQDEVNAFFSAMSQEKQLLIEEVIEADNFFQNAFDGIQNEFEAKARERKTEITNLQSEIKLIIDLDVKIRLQEEKNKMLLNKNKSTQKINLSNASKKYILKQYEKNTQKPET